MAKLNTTGMTLAEVLTKLNWTWTKSDNPARPGNRIVGADGLDYGVMHACDVWGLLRDQGLIAEAAPTHAHDRPMAAAGLTSYRYKGQCGWIMVGARDHQDALSEARRSTETPVSIDNLQVWNGKSYEPAA
jgi:hypothetical protein